MGKKTLFVVFYCFVVANVYSQQYSVKEIKITDSTKGIDINYPVFFYKNKATSSSINSAIGFEFNAAAETDIISKTPDNVISDLTESGITGLDYSVLFCNSNILSFQLYYGASGAYPAFWSKIYNFSVYGNTLTLDSLVSPLQMKDFMALLKKKQAGNIRVEEEDMKKQLRTKEIDSATYLEVKENMAGDCISNYNASQFYVSDTGLAVIIDCEFSHDIQNLTPKSEVFFSEAELQHLGISNTYFLRSHPRMK